MELNSLLVCSDERALRVLRSVLSELEIHVDHCADNASAAKKLTQKSFEAVIIDCKDERSFGLLRSVRSAQQNSKSVAIAIIDARTNLQTAFKLGANFVVYEPISAEKAKSSFRAARALMKRERRRSMRLEVNIPAYFRFQNGDGENASISGVSEGGISVRFSASVGKKSGVVGFCFALPDSTTVIEATGTIAWQDSRRRAGIQFATLSEGSKQSLKEWLLLKCEEKHDPPIRCSLKAISSGGCFLGTQSPFPAHTRVVVLLQVADCSVKTEGKVRLMDPDLGMGIEFMTANGQQNRLEELIERMTAHPASVSEVLVEPEGIDWDDDSAGWSKGSTGSPENGTEYDGLLELFRNGAALPREQFLIELAKHELAAAAQRAAEGDPSELPVNHRREPRLAVSLPVEMWGHDHQQTSTGSLVDVSHRGARIDGVAFNPKVGEVVHLVSNGCDSRFLVIWVGEPGTPREGQIGLQGLG